MDTRNRKIHDLVCEVCQANFGSKHPKQRACSRKCSGALISESKTTDPIIRFFENHIPEPNSGCWLWIGPLVNGYGSIKIGGSHFLAHRWSYEHFVAPIPESLGVLHSCDLPCCVNPDHLSPGTHQENMRQRNHRNRHARGERMGCSKLTPDDVLAIRAQYTGERGFYKITGEQYGIAAWTVQGIVTRRSWKHLP